MYLLRAKVTGKFYQAIDRGEPWALSMCLRNQFGWDSSRGGFHIDPAALLGDDGKRDKSVNVVFVLLPGGRNGSGRALSQEALEAEPEPGQVRSRAPWATAASCAAPPPQE
jgi:hypothetical protein